VPGCAEVVALAKSFNRMVEFLRRGNEGRDRAEHALSDAVTRYQTLMATASDAIHILDQDGDLVQFSQSFLDMLGYTLEEAACLNVRDWEAQVPAHRLAESINVLMREPGTFETKHRRKDGSILEVEISAKSVMLSGRRYLYASARDISRRKKAEEALRESEERSRRLFEHAPVGIYRSTMDGHLITANATHARIHGFVSLEELRKHLQDGTRSLFADPAQHAELRRLLREHGSVKGYESRRKRKDGSTIWVASNAHLISAPGFDEPVIEGFVVDVTERKRAEAELTRLATTDPLTGVSNRRLFFDRGAKEFARSHRHGLPLALIMLDIDHFKAINDTYGHTCGDIVLQTMAAQCMEILRAEDLFGRLGGEEFAALLTHTDLQGAQRTAGRLLDALAGLEVPCEENVIRFTVSIGVAVLESSDASIEDILLRADNAMYRAKRAGRNCVC
jgi:diguanylate cyclase (GGDEF)-like protein/PAS domain S-box-containing protein